MRPTQDRKQYVPIPHRMADQRPHMGLEQLEQSNGQNIKRSVAEALCFGWYLCWGRAPNRKNADLIPECA